MPVNPINLVSIQPETFVRQDFMIYEMNKIVSLCAFSYH